MDFIRLKIYFNYNWNFYKQWFCLNSFDPIFWLFLCFEFSSHLIGRLDDVAIGDFFGIIREMKFNILQRSILRFG